MKTSFKTFLVLTTVTIFLICLTASAFMPQELDVSQLESNTGGVYCCADGTSDCNGDEQCDEIYIWCGVGNEGEKCVKWTGEPGQACYYRDPDHCYNGRTNEGCCIYT